MDIKQIGFNSLETDNNMAYISHIIRCIEVIDPGSSIIVSKSINGFGWTIRFSHQDKRDILTRQIRAAHFTLGLEIEVTSVKLSPFITCRLLSMAR